MNVPPQALVTIGDALIDEIRDESGVREFIGGAALNVAVGLRRLGTPASLIAMVGSDAAGDRIRTYLSDHRVPLIETAAPHGSMRAVVTQSDAGEPQYAFNDAARQRTIEYSSSARAAIAAAPQVVVSSFPFDIPDEVEALREALAGRPLILDPNPRNGLLRDSPAFVRGFESLVAGAVVKLSDDDAALLYGAGLDAVETRMRSLGAHTVLATRGAEGASLSWPGGRVSASAPSLPGRVVDTVGAGDAVVAVAAAALAASGAVSDVTGARALLEQAMAVAAATCRGAGGLLRLPAREGPEAARIET